MEFWHLVTIAIAGTLFAIGLIMGWYWLVFVGLAGIPACAIWGFVATGPGSKYNQYPEH